MLPWSRNATKTWFRCQRLIGSLVSGYRKCYKLNADEAWSAAALGFCRAFDSFDGRRGVKIKTWVYWKVKGALEDLREQADKEAARPEVQVAGQDFGVEEPAPFDGTSLYHNLNLKGLYVVKLILKPTRPMRLRMRRMGIQPDDAAGIRRVLVWYLRWRGWSRLKIRKVFNHVKECL